MDAIWQDLRIAARRLSRNRGFTIVAVVTLALGIGVNSAIFSLVDAVLLRPLPFEDQDRLVVLYERRDRGRDNVSAHEFLAWREATNVLQSATMYRSDRMALSGRGDATSVNLLRVTANFFDVLGIAPRLGRGFVKGEDEAAANKVVVLSHRFWRERLNADSAVVGQTILLDNAGYLVVGVMPSSGEFDPDAWLPFDLAAEARTVGRHALTVIARLQPGVSIARTNAELNAISARLERDMPQMNTGHHAGIISVYEDVVGDAKTPVLAVLSAVGLVLLIACANVAHLLLARAAGRRREIAVCGAIGASRGRIISQLLSESVLISMAGGAIGLLIAEWLVALAPTFDAVRIPRLAEARVDTVAVAVTFLASLITGMISGLLPAIRASRVPEVETLSAGSRSARSASGRLADVLIVSEVAFALMILVGAGLVVRSFAKLTSIPTGLAADNVVVFSTSLAGPRYTQPLQQRAGYAEIDQRISRLPNVTAVGGTTELPLSICCNSIAISFEGQPPQPPGQEHTALLRVVTGDYFGALGIPLISGRTFLLSDSRLAVPVIRWWAQQPYPPHFSEPQAAPVAVINQAMARRYWPNGDAVGKRFSIIASPWITVVGIVGDVRHRGLGLPASPEFYLPDVQEPSAAMTMVVRTGSDPMSVAAAVRSEIRAFDRNVPVGEFQTMNQVVHHSTGGPRFNAIALGSFAALALVLSLVGIYGVISNAVAQRTREIGIRGALGASTRDVLQLILGRAARLTVLGVAIGVAGALALTRLMKSMLFEVTPTDPATYLAIALLLGVTSLLASYVPARRAVLIDPLVALKED